MNGWLYVMLYTNKCGFGMNWTYLCTYNIIKRNAKFISCICGISLYVIAQQNSLNIWKTLNQIKNTFWGLEQEICWDWLYEQQEGNIYGKTSENFNMFFLNFPFHFIFFLLDRLCVTIDEWNISQMHLGI